MKGSTIPMSLPIYHIRKFPKVQNPYFVSYFVFLPVSFFDSTTNQMPGHLVFSPTD